MNLVKYILPDREEIIERIDSKFIKPNIGENLFIRNHPYSSNFDEFCVTSIIHDYKTQELIIELDYK